jgi:hypothetical protein
VYSVGYSTFRAAVVIVAVIVGNSAYAATVSCPGTAATADREFGLTTNVAASCLAYGPGNINMNNDAINQLGYVNIDKSDTTDKFVGLDGEITITGGPNSGHFTLSLPTGYKNFVLALKSGEGQKDPDWVAFLLAAGTTEGDWTISSQGFSHANLYAQQCTTDSPCAPAGNTPATTPLPGALWLFGSVVAGSAAYGRWRKRRKAASSAA